MRKALLCLSLGLILLSTTVYADADNGIVHPIAPEGIMIARVAEGLDHGNMSVFHEYLNAGGNSLYSPYSLKGALGILYPGISGVSKEQIDEVLGFTPDTVASLDRYEQALGNSGVKSANRTYLNNSYVIHTENLRETGIESMPFGTEEERRAVVEDVNAFVAENTEDKITDILQEENISPETGMLAVNALYFNKLWAFKDDENFMPDDIIAWSDDAFYESVGIRDESGEWLSNVKTDGEIDITRLPYEAGESDIQYAMYLITDGTEAESQGVKDYLLAMDDEKLNEVTDFEGYEPDGSFDEVTIRFPKFEFESRLELPEMLKAAGLTQMFQPSNEDGTPNLDFAAISDPEENGGQVMYVDNVIQSTYVNVNETGTEAAAATAVVMAEGIALDPEAPVVKHVLADDPFGFVIKDETNNVVLFMGFVEDMSEIGTVSEL